MVVFMRCGIYLSTVFFFWFSFPSIHSYLQAETRPAIMPSPIMPFSGLQKRKILGCIHSRQCAIQNGHIAEHNICDWFWRDSPQPYPCNTAVTLLLFPYIRCIHSHDRKKKKSFLLESRETMHVCISVFG